MKNIFCSLFFVLGLCLSTYSNAMKNVGVCNPDNVRHKHQLITNPTHDETHYSFSALMEEENDDISVEKEGFFPRISVTIIAYLSTGNLNDHFFKRNAFFNYLLNPTQSGYSYFRVLRI